MTPINLHHLRLFRAIALEGSLTAAARQLNLSPSALSSQIKTLETVLGHALFERVGRSMTLSEAGRIALDHAEAIFRTAEDLAATLKDAAGSRNTLRVGALATLSRNFQLQFLQPLIGVDNVRVTFRSGGQAELLRDLEALALDVVLTNLAPAPNTDSVLLAHRVADQPVSLIGTPTRAGANRESLAVLLSREPLVLPASNTSLRAAFDALAARMGIQPRVAAEADDMAMLRLLARENAGLAVLPPIVVRDELDSGILIEVAKLEEIHETFYAVTRARRFPNPLLASLLQQT
jgi:LysR family transcriptional activator of nhaA